MDNWTLQPIISPTILAIVVAILLLMLFVGPSFSKLTFRRRLSLGVLRLGVILLALTAMLRPGCVQKVHRSQSSVLLMLLDITRSMELPHRADSSTRWNALRAMLDEHSGQLAALKEKQIEVRFFGFDNQLKELDLSQQPLPEKPFGGETDIGSAVYKVSQSARNERIIAVAVASDGVQNALDPEVELSQAAEILNGLKAPLFAIPFGLPDNSGSVADVAIKSFPEQHRCAVKNELNAEATVVARGFANTPITMQLILIDKAGNEQVVDSRPYTPTRPYEEAKVQLKFVPTIAGNYRLRIRAVPQPGEVATRNNELPSFLNVEEGGLRVLYLEGNVGWEQSYLHQAIPAAAQGIELKFVTIYPDERERKNWPSQGVTTQYLADPTFDVIMIGDLDSSALYDAKSFTKNLDLIVEAVDRGAGLIMMGGYHSFGPGGYANTPLADILPIQMHPNERQTFPPAPIRKELHIEHDVKMFPTKRHYITRIDEEGGVRAWDEIPALHGANILKPKDNAEILLKGDAGNPILVAGRVGGRVLAFAGDSTWRWVMNDKEEEYNRFWRQIVLWLAAQDGRENNAVWIDLPQRRFQPLSYVDFQCKASDATGALVNDANFVVTLLKPDGTKVTVAVDPASQKGEIERELLADSGLYEIQVSGSRNGKQLGSSSYEFIVFDRDKEKAIPAADPDTMKRLADQTATDGGQVVLPEDFSKLLTALAENPPEQMSVPLKWQLGDSTKGASLFLFAFVALLMAEWVLRKKWGLV